MVKVKPKLVDLDLIFFIDRSGSMYGSEEDTIGGFNSFIDKEKVKEGNTRVTTILFDHGYEVLYKRKSICDVSKLTRKEYFVRGSTALLDAIGRTITTLDKEIDNKVLFVIMTDGMENSSVEFSKSQIKSMIGSHNWEFLFIGADIDSYSEARSIGIKESHTAHYRKSREGIKELYDSVELATDYLREDMCLEEVNWKQKLEKYD